MGGNRWPCWVEVALSQVAATEARAIPGFDKRPDLDTQLAIHDGEVRHIAPHPWLIRGGSGHPCADQYRATDRFALAFADRCSGVAEFAESPDERVGVGPIRGIDGNQVGERLRFGPRIRGCEGRRKGVQEVSNFDRGAAERLGQRDQRLLARAAAQQGQHAASGGARVRNHRNRRRGAELQLVDRAPHLRDVGIDAEHHAPMLSHAPLARRKSSTARTVAPSTSE
ncbi:MAG TPA: hypothetical protein VFU07_00565 [Candidatus Lumbricidophila sp.]|nr:hypothetical protein [Candidatus Lumbricidophila sp.]